ncbi:ABC transporter permease [Chamaesiphon sp. VAR_48_metabat_403]|uniref:ABC transporter permease n=1 Tax=Chamaesiphon sp. VAR_48_metabat_403 TaxID=2964700 RepID=UPI00286E6D4C|nr:ABC transporter permease [Chamaesiphon sp. VAR_48_metabat_403]
MSRYLNIIKIFWKTAISAELEYRLNFVFAALSSLGGLAGSLFSLFLFYRKDYNFQGWKWQEALIVVGIFTFLEGFSSTFLASNLNRIVKHVQDGTLDFVLLKPINSQFWLSFHSFSLWGLPDLLFGLAIIVYAGSLLGIGVSAYLFAAVPLLFGVVIMYSLWFMLGATSIWFTKIYNITEVLRGLLAAGRFPIGAYPAAYRFFFTFVVPVTFLTTVPAQTLLGRADPAWIVSGGCLAVVLLILSNRVWRFALRFYTSASS